MGNFLQVIGQRFDLRRAKNYPSYAAFWCCAEEPLDTARSSPTRGERSNFPPRLHQEKLT